LASSGGLLLVGIGMPP